MIADPFAPAPYAVEFSFEERLWDLLAFGVVSGRLDDDESDLLLDLATVDGQFDRLVRQRRQAYENGYYEGQLVGVYLGLAARRCA